MSNVSVIVPINELNERLVKFLDNAVLSIANQVEKPKEVKDRSEVLNKLKSF